MKSPYRITTTLAALLCLSIQPVTAAQAPDVGGAVDAVVERQVEQAREQVERVQRQAEGARDQAGQVQEQIQEQVERQIDRAQAQAENVQRQAERVSSRTERVQRQAENAASQAERAGNQTGRIGDRLPGAAADRVERAREQAARRAAAPADLPDRLEIPSRENGAAFVEIAIAPNIRVLEREWIMLVTAEQREQLRNQSPELMRFLEETSAFDALEGFLLKFRVPPDLDTDTSIRELVPEELRDLIDRNHVYSSQSVEGEAGPQYDRLSLPMDPVCTDALSIGMIDSGIDAGHPAFSRRQHTGGQIVTRDFVDEAVDSPQAHGTAVAAVLVGEGPDLQPLLPAARLYGASVFYSRDADHQGATAMDLLEALDWLIGEDVAVINMSLAGPPNRLLEQALATARARGRIIVAAAGNAGPHAELLYPAGYPDVITATAVSPDRSVYRWASQGDHIDFSALGVSVPTAVADGGFGRESGTSMAAPVVSAFLACALAASNDDIELALMQLERKAVDLGSAGHDPVFGHGLLHP